MLFDSALFNDKENQASFEKESQVIHHKIQISLKMARYSVTITYSYVLLRPFP